MNYGIKCDGVMIRHPGKWWYGNREDAKRMMSRLKLSNPKSTFEVVPLDHLLEDEPKPALAPHEQIRDSTKLVHVMQARRNVHRRLELADTVDGLTVPYVIDEVEYLRRIEARDAPRRAAKHRECRLREARKMRP
jgi:hypothetical protein